MPFAMSVAQRCTLQPVSHCQPDTDNWRSLEGQADFQYALQQRLQYRSPALAAGQS